MHNIHVSVCQKLISILSLGTCFYSVDTHNRNRLKSLVTMSRVTYFILWAHMGKCISHNTVEKQEEGLEKINEGEWTRQAEIRTRKNFLAVGKACVAVFWSTPGTTWKRRSCSDARLSSFRSESFIFSLVAAAFWIPNGMCGSRRKKQCCVKYTCVTSNLTSNEIS